MSEPLPPVPPRAKLPTPVVGTPGGASVAVHVEEPEPTIVEVRASVQAQSAQEVETTLHTEGQRAISMIWETTQQRIALMVVGAAMGVAIIAALIGQWLGISPEIRLASAMFAFGAANLVIGFYYGRTNHQRVGGPGGDQAGTR